MQKLLLFLFLCLSTTVWSQNHSISGKVTDEKGNPVPAASVQLKGTKRGTTTGSDGSFTLSVPSSAKTLTISSVNFTPQDVTISSNMLVVLRTTSQTIAEVVVVAYGTQKRTNVTGSISTVKASEIEDKPFSSVDKVLQGEVAGLQASSFSGAPGSATDILIRGIGSINASNSPLWVIDGVIATTGDLTVNTTTANTLSSLNPDDVESITVLKDAAATAVYGSRASNGVILVTTKRGRAGKTALSFSTEVGQNSSAFDPENKPMNSIQDRTIMREALINANFAPNDAVADQIIDAYFVPSPDYVKTNTDWRSLVTRNAPQAQYNLSLNGGDDKTQFYASAGFFRQDGTTIATDFRRYNGDVSVTHKVGDKFIFTAGLSGSTSFQNTPLNSGTFGNPVLAAQFLLPWDTPYNPDGSLRYDDPQGEFPQTNLFNPLVQAAWNKYQDDQTTLRGNVSGEYKILDNLKVTSRYSAEYFDVVENSYLNPFYGDGWAANNLGGDVSSNYRRVFDWTWSNFADYTKSLNAAKDIYFDVKAGVEAYQVKDFSIAASGGVTPQTLSLNYLNTTGKPTGAGGAPSELTTNSVFSVADINIKDRYVFSGSFRRDGSSNFGADHRWGNFYSVGATWNINEENFLKNSRTISLLKLRTSYGETGNSNIGTYPALPLYGYSNPYNLQPGSAISNVGNPNLTWEKNSPFDVGVDVALWKNRLYSTVDYYDRKTSNLLLLVPLSLTSGISTQFQNVGAMDNKGIEITLGGRPVDTKDFTWDVSFNFSHNVNRITQLYSGATSLGATGLTDITVGHDVQEYYMREWAGVNPANGAPLWYSNSSKTGTSSDISSSDSVPQSLTGLSASPKYFGSLTNTFSYKGLSLQIQLYYNYGNYIFQLFGSYLSSDGGYAGSYNQLSQQLTAWQKPGQITNVPQIVYGDPSGSNTTSTRYLYNGDYVRLRNLQLSYAFPKAGLRFRNGHISNLVIYVRGTNLITWVKDKTLPFDPEQGVSSNDNLDVYIPKTIALGLKIGL